MRFLEIFSKSIFRLAAGKSLKKIRANSVENVLARSLRLLDEQTLNEIRKFIIRNQTSEGGFADRAGKCDLYYSLFGLYISEALGVLEVLPALRKYVEKVSSSGNLKGIHKKCAVILNVKLSGTTKLPEVLKSNAEIQIPYSDFINLLVYYYSEDFYSLFKAQRKLMNLARKTDLPCSVTAANLILAECSVKPVTDLENRLHGFYRGNGSFSAVKGAPQGDLLSTGVALYALRFADSEMRLIKPDCLNYIDSLYSEGGFCATSLDPEPDVEYTFYGLLALGALSD